MNRLRLIVMGSAGFAVPTLNALAAAGHAIAAVYTRPPKPKGRGQREQRSPLHARADELGIPVRTPRTLRDPDEQAAFAALGAAAAVVAAYGLMLPAPILAAPRLGCLNVHASLLPRWRGAAPIERAIMAGDTTSGVTIMRMEEGLDIGPMLLRSSVPIGPRTTAGELHDALAALGARLILEALDGIAAGTLAARPQPAEGVTYAAKLTARDECLDWAEPAVTLERRVRALAPRPGAWFGRAGERIKVLAAEVAAAQAGAAPGTVLDGRLTIACGVGALRPLILQRPGRAPMAADAFLRGYAVAAGERLEAGSVPSRPDTASAKA